MKNYLPWPKCCADSCPQQGKRGKLNLCLAKAEKKCLKKDRRPYGAYDIEDIFWPSIKNTSPTDST